MSGDLGAAGVWLIILAMAVVTYAMRAGGFLLMGYVPMTGRVRAFLQALPGAVVVALVVPVAARGGLAATAAVLAALAMMAWWRNDLIAVLSGVAAAALVRAALM
jgi:uncharacterized membrane protein